MNSSLRLHGATLCTATLACLLVVSAAPVFAQTAGFALPADLTPSRQQPPQVARQKRIDDALARKQYSEALAELDKDVAEQPRNAQARFQRGVALAGLGRADDAIVAFSQMTQDFPELPEPYINLAALYAERGELLRARDNLIMASRVAPENALAQSNLGDVYVRLAAQSYQHALKLNPKNANARARLEALPDLPGMRTAPKPAATLPAASGVSAQPAKRQ
jgi:tetratricopeptide (TPR) repeat protein